MQITRSSLDTQKGPADWFTGDVYIDTVATPTDAIREADESGSPVTWGRHVTDEEYAQAPSTAA